MNVNSDSLFHYTKGGFDILIKIVKEGFRISYCEEINPIMFSNHEIAINPPPGSQLILDYNGGYRAFPRVDWLIIPMVSFCDIPRRNIASHIEEYGFYDNQTKSKVAYGVGLSQDWAARNNLRQVSYEYSQNESSKIYRQSYKAVPIEDLQIHNQLDNHLNTEKYFPPKSIGGYLSVIKDNKGNEFPFDFLLKKPIEIKRVVPYSEGIVTNFRKENEWRYIPSNGCVISYFTFNHFSTHRVYYESVRQNMQKARCEAPSYSNLKFSPSDIDFIIVGHNSERSKLVDELAEIARSNGWNDKDLKELSFKIDTYENIVRN